MNNSIELKPVKDLLGMNFYIPEYQRGYRWDVQQAEDLLEDIYSFAKTTLGRNKDEIYCIQPLVVSNNEDENTILQKCQKPGITLEEIKKIIKGSWTVVDGQQRLTTIYLLLDYLDCNNKYEINYCTRKESKDFLKNIKTEKEETAKKNIDYFHMFKVYEKIKEWGNNKDAEEKEQIKHTLLNKVNYIWYEVKKEDATKVFTRLNIGKIPLTDSELIKALFLNKDIFSGNIENSSTIDFLHRRIALEWDQIENCLQDDEFWSFIHTTKYNRPTRIDFILDLIANQDVLELKKQASKESQDNIEDKTVIDLHKTFRYFNEAFNLEKESITIEIVTKYWKRIKDYFLIFNEWYHDYQLYHYIGYCTSISNPISIYKLVKLWNESPNKNAFIKEIKNRIINKVFNKDWIKTNSLESYQFDQEGNKSKRDCVDFLLLHNIETIIQQNNELISESKYNLPNFTKFPFHLFKREKWHVEHICPNAGDDLDNEDKKKFYLLLAKEFLDTSNCLSTELSNEINNYIEKDEGVFSDILSKVNQIGGALDDVNKNKIWNFVLLDEKTNIEYQNQIFCVKRAFILNKENGKKIIYAFKDKKLEIVREEKEVAFIPPCTRNVFCKNYTLVSPTMVNWNNKDADAYLDDIKKKLEYYLNKVGVNKCNMI